MHFLRGGGGGGANIDNMKNTKKITYFCLKMKYAISFNNGHDKCIYFYHIVPYNENNVKFDSA